MRARKIAKQLKRFFTCAEFVSEDDMPVASYKVAQMTKKCCYVERMTRKHYFGLMKNADGDKRKYYAHKACDPFLFEEVLKYWNIW